jgi:Protein of unknown function (DUF5131)
MLRLDHVHAPFSLAAVSVNDVMTYCDRARNRTDMSSGIRCLSTRPINQASGFDKCHCSRKSNGTTVRGCTKISPGCKNCYAERFSERFRGVKGHPFEQAFDLKVVPHKLGEPLRWSQPRMIFVNSMSDLFHEGVAES